MAKDEGEEGEEGEVRIWSWGAGTDGQLATGILEDRHAPHPLPNFPSSSPISHIACGGAHAVALTGDGKVLTWGRGTHGQLGHGELRNCLEPKLVKFFQNFTVSYVSAGWNHSGFVTENGQLFMCGDGSFGQLGCGDYQSHASPLEVPFFLSRHVEQIACGMRHTLVLVRGSLGEPIYGFGSGRRGQIGLPVSGKGRSSNLPKAIDGFDNCEIVYICANGDNSAALAADGQLFTWGRGFSGSIDEHYPQICPSSLRFSQVALGWNHALVIADDDVYMLGGRHHGMLASQQANLEQQTSVSTASCSGSNETSPQPSLQRVPCLEGEKVAHIAAGAEHSALVTEKGIIMTWGWGEHGQLGLGDTDDRTCPNTVYIKHMESTASTRFRVHCGSGFTFVYNQIPWGDIQNISFVVHACLSKFKIQHSQSSTFYQACL